MGQDIHFKRSKFLYHLYELSGADKLKGLNKTAFGRDLGLSRDEIDQIAQFFEKEKLVDYTAMGDQVSITDSGIEEVRKALSQPEKPTKYFQSLNIYELKGKQESSKTSRGFLGKIKRLLQP